MARLIYELAIRLERVGLVEDRIFQIPLTQTNLADACCLSTVHIIRTLQDLRRRGLIRWRTVTLLEYEGLAQIAEAIPDASGQRRMSN